MSRQYVHLSLDTDMAHQVASRKSKEVCVFAVDANKANANGTQFYKGNNHVWLADYVPADYLHLLE